MRATARPGWENGLFSVGARGTPASSADSASVSAAAGFSKYNRAAASMPTAPCPNGARLT
jgi:hypothetical protein